MAHILGILAVVTFLLSFQFKTRRNIIVVNLISRALYILQYILLGAFEGAVLDFTGFLLSFFARHKERTFVKRHMSKGFNLYYFFNTAFCGVWVPFINNGRCVSANRAYYRCFSFYRRSGVYIHF